MNWFEKAISSLRAEAMKQNDGICRKCGKQFEKRALIYAVGSELMCTGCFLIHRIWLLAISVICASILIVGIILFLL